MKKNNLKSAGTAVILLLVLPAFFIISCKKKVAFKEEDAQDTYDVRSALGETDELIKDLNTVVAEQFLLRGRPEKGISSASTTVCGAVLDTTRLTSGIVVITYTGATCFGRTRTGMVTAVFENYPIKKWKDPGAVVNVTLDNYKVMRSSSGRSWQLDGAFKMINQTGGSWYDLQYLNQPLVTNDLQGDKLKVTFSTGDYAFLNINRRLNFTFSSQVTRCEVRGLGRSGGQDQLECWGQNRQAVEFSCKVTMPYVWTTACGATVPFSGETEVRVSGKDYVLKSQYSVDKDGNDVAVGACPYGYRASWRYKNNTNERILGF
jgi:hypothetical protein